MTEMILRGLAIAAGTPFLFFFFCAPACAEQPVRYMPVPGKPYLMFNVTNRGESEVTSSETVQVPTQGMWSSSMESTWKVSSGELGITVGYGMGSLPLVKSLDCSLYIPLAFRSYKFIGYLWDGDPRFAQSTLHNSLREGEGSVGLGDMELSTLALFYADPGSGFYVSGGFNVSFATGSSTQERFLKMLHGSIDKPGTGAGVMQLTPRVTAIKTIAGQRAYLSFGYSLPLGSESFSFVSQSDDTFADNPPTNDYLDEGRLFREEIKLGGVFKATLGVQTSLNIRGVRPSLELNVRQMSAASWKENGVDGLAYDPGATSAYPTHTPEFLKAAAWSVGNMPLKSNTEIEIGFIVSYRMVKRSEVLRAGISYITDSFGNSIAFKIAYLSMLVSRSKDEMPKPEGVYAEEIEVSPLLAAPSAPKGLVRVAVAFPALGAGTSQTEGQWVADLLRKELAGRRGYDMVSGKQMAQLATMPCGDANCGVSYGRALDLRGMIVSRLERIEDANSPGSRRVVLTVQMINVSDGAVSSTGTVSGSRLDDLAPQVGGLIDRMTGASPAAGKR